MNQAELFEELPGPAVLQAPDPAVPVTLDNAATPALSELFEISIDAYYTALYARMSELPIEAEISRFVVKVWEAAAGSIINGGSTNGDGTNIGGTSGKTLETRIAAEKAASDRGDPDVLVVQKAAYKVQHEIHRLEGFLRFNPDSCGVYVARCAPDHFTLPALAEHFFLRFGETPWVIIDEKRKLCLYRKRDCQPILIPSDSAFISAPEPNAADDPWENLWRLYHRSVNNESRKNVKLQRQFMPERYRKYLSELK